MLSWTASVGVSLLRETRRALKNNADRHSHCVKRASSYREHDDHTDIEEG